MKDKEKTRDVTSLIVAIIAMIVTLASFLTQENLSPQTYILFSAIVVVVFLGLGVVSIVNKWNEMNQKIEENSKTMEELQKSLKDKELYNNMDKRVSIVEKLADKILFGKNRKGQAIDPRILFWILSF